MNITYAKNKKAFTLIEIIVVVTIIGILSAITLPSVTGYMDTNKKNQVLALAQNYFDVAKSAVNDIHSGQFKSSSGDPIKFLLQDTNQKVSNVTSAYFISGEYIAYYPENRIQIIGKDGTLAQLTAGYAPLESYVEQTVTVADTSTFDGQLKCVTNAMSKYILEPSKLKMGGIRVGESIDFDNPIAPPDNSSSGSSSTPTGNNGKLKAPLNLSNKSTDTGALTGGSAVQNVLTWDAVANATSYAVTITDSANPPVSVLLNVTSPTADISTLTTTAGDYAISVIAKADNYTDSDSATLNLHKMAEVTNLTAVENNDETITLTWSGVNSKTGKYLLHHKSGALEDTRLVVPTTNATTKTVTIDLKDILDTSTNSLRISVRSFGNASNIISSNYAFVTPLSKVSVVNTATTNPTGTFVGRAYKADMINLTPGTQYSLKLYAPSSTTAYETINFTPTSAKHTVDLTGKFKPIIIIDAISGVPNGVHKITLYRISPINGEVEVQTTTRDISFYYGNGSYKQNPNDAQDGTASFYAISDPESLQALSLKVNVDHANFADKNYKQVATVDMEKGYKTATTFEQVANFTPIGDKITPSGAFNGSYDGGAKADRTGYEIRNLKINSNNTYIGLFSLVGNSTLKNIGIGAGSVITNNRNYASAIAGKLLQNVVVTNCYNLGNVTSTHLAGGLFGETDENVFISDCYNAGTIIGGDVAAGIVGRFWGNEIKNCYNIGSVSSGRIVAGITGDVGNGKITTLATLANCYNTGTLTGTDSGGVNRGYIIIGGILGSTNNQPLTITNCYNTGLIEDVSNCTDNPVSLGGIAGAIDTTASHSLIENSYNTGIIRSNSKGLLNFRHGGGFGGIVGRASKLTIKNCINRNTATIVTTSALNATLGGIIGKGIDIIIENCKNEADITSPGNHIGGIWGVSESNERTTNNVINDVTNTGTIQGKQYVGGIMGSANIAKITLATNSGRVSGDANVGGIVGGLGVSLISIASGDATISNSSNSGLISGKSNTGGIVGRKDIGTVSSCFNTGDIEIIPSLGTTRGTGGVIGTNTGGSITGCYNTGRIITLATTASSGSHHVGGVVGTLSGTSSLSNSYNTGSVEAFQYVGGVAGALDGGNISQCYNTGNVSALGDKSVGGIVGRTSGASITDSYNTGDVTHVNIETGGIVGTLRGTFISNCYNVGNITGFQATGGLFGSIAQSNVVNSYNTGNVTGTMDSGGVVGFVSSFNNSNNTVFTNTRYKNSITITGTVANNDTVSLMNTPYINIYGFLNATGDEFDHNHKKWNKNGQLVTSGGSSLPGPNPGDTSPYIAPTITVRNSSTQNASGTFANRAYEAKIENLEIGNLYQMNFFRPNDTKNSYRTIAFRPSASTYETLTIDLTGKFNTTMLGTNGVHTIKLSDVHSATPRELATTTRDISFYYGNGSYKQSPDDAQDGTADFYAISDPESLQALSLKVNGDNANFGAKNYKQIATINMTPVANFTPIGNFDAGTFFRGTYDGGTNPDGSGFRISNLTSIANQRFVGLFGSIDGATLKNIRIDAGSHITGGDYVGGITGYANNKSTIQNCYNSAAVTATGSYAGGIVGQLFSIGSTVTQCYNVGAVSANSYAGGIAGGTGGGTFLTYSSNTGAVSGSTNIGGVSGVIDTSDLNYSYNTGRVTGSSDRVGGVTGSINGSTVALVYNTGIVTSTAGMEVGGVTGVIQAGSTLKNAYNTGHVTAKTVRAGGVVGHQKSPTTIDNCFNTGNVTGTSAVGGAVGIRTTSTGQLVSHNIRFKNTVVVRGATDNSANSTNIQYSNIMDFVTNTALHRKNWDNNARLLKPDGTLMAGPNPGGA